MTRTEGVLIVQEADAFELRWIDGKVVAFSRDYDDDGNALASWQAIVIGAPERAKRIWPGQKAQIEEVCR